MSEKHHDINHEFPEHRDLIIKLKTSNHHFQHLSDEYSKVTGEIEGLEHRGSPESDAFMEELKKKRLRLKDQLYDILQQSK
ncbi:MAG: DUF465 domain-containing protein [Turneriella sp.]